MVSCTARLLSSLCPFALDCWFIDTDYWRYILGTLETDFAWIEVDTVLLVSLKCRLQIIVFAMQMSSWQQQCHCFLTLKTIVRSQSAVCILHCPPFNANPQKLIFTLFEGIMWHFEWHFFQGPQQWWPCLSYNSWSVSSSITKSMSCYKTITAWTDQIIHMFTCLCIESQNKTVTCGIQQLIL